MAIGEFFFFFGLMFLVVEVHMMTGLNCPNYDKHEAVREGLLNNRAICRSRGISFNVPICLNGYTPELIYCATDGCNIFGHNCKGHCLTGDDFIHDEDDKDLKCNIDLEIENLCKFYLEYEPNTVFYSIKLQKLCPNLLSKCLKAIYKKWKY